MAKPLEIEDETGTPWLIYEGDPAWPLLYKLKPLKLVSIVLPRDTIATGRISCVNKPSFPGLDKTQLTDGLKVIIKRLYRMYDIYRYLEGKESK